MNDTDAVHGTFVQPVIRVRVGQNPDRPHTGTLSIGNWSVPCATGRGGLIAAHLKREGDGATPIGCYPMRYGFIDPTAFSESMFRGLAFPFLPKPATYAWPEDGLSPFYNRMVFDFDAAAGSRLGDRIFDLIIPIGWNDSVAQPFAGSAIFLHVAGPDFPPTAGCVTIAHDQVTALAQRLRPGMMIDIGHVRKDARIVPPSVPPAAIETSSFHALTPGPRIIVTGAVHGDEPSGPRAISRLIANFRSGALTLTRGTLTFVPVVNTLAWHHGRREGERNLNRDLCEKTMPQSHEDRVANILCPLLRAHDVLIDLHSFASDGAPMVLIGPTDNAGHAEPFAHEQAETALGLALGLPLIVHGWVAAHQRSRDMRADLGLAKVPAAAAAIGTTEYMRFAGGYGVTIECGQHDAPLGAEIGYLAVLRALAHLGVIKTALPPAPRPTAALEIVEPVLSSHPQDRLDRRFAAGERIVQGQVLGHRHDGTDIVAGFDGAVIFASETAAPGTELCFLCRHSPRLGSCVDPAAA